MSAMPRAGGPAAWSTQLMLGGGVLLLALFALTVAGAAGAAPLWENAHWTVVALITAALGYLRYRAAPPEDRTAHAAIALGLGLYLAGQLAWDVQVVLGLVTVPALSDLGFLSSALPIGWAFVHRLRRSLDRAERVAFALDATIVGATALLLVWMAYGSTAVVASDPLAGVILIAYPVAFLSAAGIGALAALRSRVAASWRGITPLLLGLAGTGLAWVLWLEQAITEIPSAGSPINYAFSMTWFAVGVGAFHLRLDRVGTRTLDRVATVAELLFPMLAIAAVLTGLVVAEVAHHPRPHAVKLLGAAAVVGLAIARQSLLLAERQRLAARDRQLSLKEREARAEAERALAAHQAGEARYRQVVEVFGRLGEQLSFAADEPTLIRGGVAALRKLVGSDAGDLLLANASQDRLVVGSAWGPAAPGPEEVIEGLRPTSCLGIRRGSVYGISDAADDLMLACPAHPIERGSLLCVPMLALGQTIGVVHLEAAEPNAFGVDDERQAQRVAEQVALAIANARLVRTMESMALTDPLTRLHNARFFDPFLDRELASRGAGRRADGGDHDRPRPLQGLQR